jgi:NTP pyrophosphatase (non-canonical NTP hydrolase)
MTYYIYHIPGKKIGMTCDLENRVTKQQGYEPHEYEVLTTSEDIDFASDMERQLQKEYGYKVDRQLYKNLKTKTKNMNINVTEQTTTFPCPVNKLKGQLMDNIGMTWETEHGVFFINEYSIKWIMANIKTSMFNKQRSYVYNKAFARFYDNHQTHSYDYSVTIADPKTLSTTLASTGIATQSNPRFDLIREWAQSRGIYDGGDPKTQALKLVEEVGETCRAILKEDASEMIDGIGDCVVVLTNLAELIGTPIEECIDAAYDEIKDRTGKIVNGTYKKD